MESGEFLKAVSTGDRIAVRQALAASPSWANLKAESGASVIQWAVYHGQRDTVEDLLAAGADVDFWTACTIGRIDKMPTEIFANALSPDRFRPVALAAAFGHNEVVRFLLDKGADPNLGSPALGDVPPLQSAVFGRNVEGARILIDAGANLETTQPGGFTALMGAAQNADEAMIQLLLDAGARRDARDEHGKTAMDWCPNDQTKRILREYKAKR